MSRVRNTRDTLRCGDERIRLLAIDAPEKPGQCRAGRTCAPGDPFASERSLSAAAKPTMSIRRIGYDRYGRTLALMEAEGVTLTFEEEAIDALADLAVKVNDTVENIGARRLQTVLERLLDEISFTAPDRKGETVTITADYVRAQLSDLVGNADLSKFIL